MKKLFAIILILAMLCGCALADVITVDTDTATAEEIEAVIEVLQKAVKEKKGETGPEMHTFSNGMSVGVARIEKENDIVRVYYLFSHTLNGPEGFGVNIRPQVFQNGVEIPSEWSTSEYFAQSRQVLRDTTTEVPYSYRVPDDTPLTIYVAPWFGNENPYIVTVEIK